MADIDKNLQVVKRVILTAELGISQDVAGRLQLRCSKCYASKYLEEFGFRLTEEADGEEILRNQPQCSKCRGG